jgi:2-methylcitrate dehydratase PrpD
VSLSEHVADWLAKLDFESLPPTVRSDAALRILDTLGVALAGTNTPIGRAVKEAGAALGRGDEATVIGGGRSSASLGALVNGTLAHALDFDDTHAGLVMRPSAPSCAVAMAMVEATGGNGRDLLLDVAAGIELHCRLGLVAPGGFRGAGQHPASVLGTVIAAFVAARRLGLDSERMVMAAGIAGSQASGIIEAHSDGNSSKHLHPGWAAHGGIVAAHLAAAGFTGPRTVLDGLYGVFRSGAQELLFERAGNALGEQWHMLDSSFKLYPCDQPIHAFVEAALALRREHGLDHTQIREGQLSIPPSFVGDIAEPRPSKLRPETATQARASGFYAVAAALIDGRLGLEHYSDEMIRRADILSLAERLSWRSAPIESPLRFSGILDITLADGRTLTRGVAEANGTGSRSLGSAAIEAKFRETAGSVLPGDRVETLIAMCRSLDTAAAISPLLAATAVEPR